MVRVVMGWLVGVLVAVPATAMGPQAPFTPPGRVALAAKSSASMPAPGVAGALAGVRLGRAPAALIDGEWVAEGAPVRGARLLRVLSAGVDLRHADGRVERLVLFAPDGSPAAAEPAASDPALRETP